MTLTEQQLAHIDTFGFVILRQLFTPEEVALINREFDARFEEELDGRTFTGEKRAAVGSFIERSPELWPLFEDDRIQKPIEQLLGPDLILRSTGCNLYVGNTEWHRDAADLEVDWTRINFLLYLDPVERNSGCIRFVPGSHREPFNSMLRPINIGRKEQAFAEGRIPQSAGDDFRREFNISDDAPLFGVPPDELPCAAVETQPGDALIFNMYTYHATYGGRTGRRMVSLSFAAYPKTEEQLDLFHRQQEDIQRTRAAFQSNPPENRYPPAFLNSDLPRIKALASRLAALGQT